MRGKGVNCIFFMDVHSFGPTNRYKIGAVIQIHYEYQTIANKKNAEKYNVFE